MVVAILDLGTNTFHLLIAEIAIGGGYKKLFKDREPVKLLEGSAADKRIQPVPFQRGVEAMKRFSKKIQLYKAEKITAYATSATRSALNGQEFLDAIRTETGIELQVISGDQEAEYIYYGVKQSLVIGTEPALVLDIGGGSNECVICNDEQIFWKHSFNLGAARMLEQLSLSDPLSLKEITVIEKYLEKELQPLLEAVKKFPVSTLIGCSGSFDTFAEMISYRFPEATFEKSRPEYEFNIDHFKEIHSLLLSSSFEERLHMKGLIEMRADMIVIASIFTNFVMQHCKLKRMRLSKGALKEGMLWKVANENS